MDPLLEAPVECLKLKNDILICACRGRPPIITAWDLNSSKCIRTYLLESEQSISALDYDGNIICAGSNSIYVWNSVSGHFLITLQRRGEKMNITSIKILGNKTIISCCSLGSIIMWNWEKSEPLAIFPTSDGILCTQILNEGLERDHAYFDLICGSKSGNINPFRIDKLKKYGEAQTPFKNLPYQEGSDWIGCVEIDKNHDIVIAGSWDSLIRIWDARDGSLKRFLQSDAPSAVLSIAKCENVLVAGRYDGSISIWRFGEISSKRSRSPRQSMNESNNIITDMFNRDF